MKAKPIIMSAILCLTAGGVVYANRLLNQGSAPDTLVAAKEPVRPEHVVEITSYYATHAYEEDGYNKDFLIGGLDYPGSYFLMNPVFKSPKYNADGHLIDAMCYVSSDNFFLLVRAPDTHYYLTNEDRLNDKRLNVVGFANLKTIQLFMDKELNQVEFSASRTESGNYVDLDQTEDAQNVIYTFTYLREGGFADHYDPYYFRFSEGFDGKRFVLNKIILTYDC